MYGISEKFHDMKMLLITSISISKASSDVKTKKYNEKITSQ
jgi:hypothetical protein